MARPVSIFIDNVLVTIVAGSCRIDNRIEERSIASFDIIDLAGNGTYQRGQVVLTYSGETETPTGTKLFAGFIETPERIRDGNGLLWSIQCKDNHYLADKRLVVKSYPDKTLTYIVNDILTDYLAAEGITAGTIQTGPTIDEAIFNYVPASECFDALKELSGFIWQINADKTLDFLDRSTNAAPWALTYLEIVDGSAKLSTGNPAYRNRQYIRGGTGVTSAKSETFTGDTVTKAFTVGYPIAEKPVVTVNGTPVTPALIGIKGIDTGMTCYWNKGDATVTFESAPAAVAVIIDYYGQYPLITLATNEVSRAARQAIEGGTGIVEEIATEAQHESSASIQESATAKLKIYCQNAEKFTFQTRTSGLKAGQLLTVTYAPFGFSAYEMLIESVEISEEDSTHLIYSVTALTGPTLGSWTKFFSRILERQDKSIEIGDSLLLVLLQQEETLALTEVTSIEEVDFSTGESNKWLNTPPIDAGSLVNVQHERVKLTETSEIIHNRTQQYAWQ